VIVHFVDIGRIVDYRCLNFLFITGTLSNNPHSSNIAYFNPEVFAPGLF